MRSGFSVFSVKNLLVAWLLSLAAVVPANAATIHVFAAASLSDSLRQIAPAYERQTGDKLVFNFNASSLLARQIQEGAPADVFFSADDAKLDLLAKDGLLLNDTRKKLLGNTLVIVVANGSAFKIASAADLRNVSRLALAEPRTVPAGIYAREYLERQGLWRDLQRKIIPTENVRAALAAVEAGNVDAAIVYRTDAAISKKVKVAVEIPSRDTPNISYSVAVLKESRHAAAARRLVAHLSSAESQKVFESFGFIIPK